MTAITTSVNHRLLRVAEVAEQLGISRSKAYQLVSAGTIKSVQIGRSRRVKQEAVDAYLADLDEANN